MQGTGLVHAAARAVMMILATTFSARSQGEAGSNANAANSSAASGLINPTPADNTNEITTLTEDERNGMIGGTIACTSTHARNPSTV